MKKTYLLVSILKSFEKDHVYVRLLVLLLYFTFVFGLFMLVAKSAEPGIASVLAFFAKRVAWQG